MILSALPNLTMSVWNWAVKDVGNTFVQKSSPFPKLILRGASDHCLAIKRLTTHCIPTSVGWNPSWPNMRIVFANAGLHPCTPSLMYDAPYFDASIEIEVAMPPATPSLSKTVTWYLSGWRLSAYAADMPEAPAPTMQTRTGEEAGGGDMVVRKKMVALGS